VQMLGVFAKFERATLIDRSIAGMERKAATGKMVRRDSALWIPSQPRDGVP
jgi:DNA invertase Pin-like site-specific DNA recombinase